MVTCCTVQDCAVAQYSTVHDCTADTRRWKAKTGRASDGKDCLSHKERATRWARAQMAFKEDGGSHP